MKREIAFWTLTAAVLGSAACASHQVVNPAPAPVAVAASPAPTAAPVLSVAAAPAPAPLPPPSLSDNSKLPAIKLWGVIESVDAQGMKLVVKDKKGKTHELTVTAKAKLTKGGAEKAIAVSDLKSGDRVTLRVAGDAWVRAVHVNVVSSSGQVATAK